LVADDGEEPMLAGQVYSRRGFLQVGSLAAAGLTLPRFLVADAKQLAAPQPPKKSCILVCLQGGPAHQDLWDLKPDAPAEYRGEFQPIDSSLVGVPVCEHLPRLARLMHRVALVRSVHHSIVEHTVSGYSLPGLTLADSRPRKRLAERCELPPHVNRWPAEREPCEAVTVPESMDHSPMARFQQQAFELFSSKAIQRAFNLDQESTAIREQYGLPASHLGQCLLLARRLVEAGVRLVTVCSGCPLDLAWDTHRQHFPRLKHSLLPDFDCGFSALLTDLADRGLWDDTLVVAMGEFGRTPRLGQITSGAGADQASRDHWPHCYTVLLAGAGVPSGAVYGASDRLAAYPARDPVTPEDIAATLYLLLGIDPETGIYDPLRRPHSRTMGQPIVPLVG
jgi:hypothetical protein